MRIIGIIVGFAALVFLAGCKDEDRPLSYTPGEYGGKPDTALTKEQVEALRQRGMRSYQ